MNTSFFNSTFFGIRYKVILLVFLFYLFFMLSYFIALTTSFSDYAKEDSQLSLRNLIPETFDYVLKFIVTIPIWYLIFRKFKNKSLYFRLCIHIFTLPLFILVWKAIFYFVLESFGYNHLRGSSQAWDIYIAGLFYCIQFGVLHAYEYYKNNEEQQKIQSELREAALKNELAALKSQLNPHFLYNVFNTINASVPKELENTRNMIATLADMFRYQLQASQSELVTVREEINFVKQYLELEKARFEDRLEIEIEIESNILDEAIVPMIIQPLVENGIKHGLSPLIEGGKIRVEIRKNVDTLYFTVSDTGVGVADKTTLFGTGIGLTNTKLILEKMYNSTLKITDNFPRGLKIEFEILCKK